MKDLSCLNTIIPDNLAVHIDLTSINSWNLNTGFTSVSLTKWNKAISDNIFLYDFGLTAFDNGRVDKMYDTLTILPSENKVTLYRVGYNNETGGTFYDGYGITGVTSSAITSTHGTGTGTTTGVTYYGAFPGNFFDLDGGYLQGFFKLKKYNYELLPPRYGSGITIETIIRLTPESFNDGYFYFMGARAEDKYVPSFSGEVYQYTATTTAATTSSFSSSGIRTTRSVMFSGITTSESHFLNNYIDTQVLLAGSSNGQLYKTEPVATDDLGRNGNTIGFNITSDRRIGYTRINPSGITESDVSQNMLAGTGWTIIDIVFLPYDIITDRKTLDCAPLRKGDFTVYVNGRRFWKIENFDEYYFKGFKNDREKQLGVPYNISWGGGTFGLKHSYHYDLHKYVIFDQDSIAAEIGSGFTFTTDPFWNDPLCPVPPLPSDITGTTITGDSTTFVYPDMCGTGMTANTVLRIENHSNIITGSTGITATTTALNQYFILYTTELELLSNRDYIFSTNVYEENIFQPYHTGKIGFFFSGETDVITTGETIIFDANVNNSYTWTPIKSVIKTKNNTGLTKVLVGIYIMSDTTLVPDFKVYFDKFIYRGADVLNQDHTKDNLLIQQLYDNSFIGSIQKLRIYDRAFNSQEVLHNARIEGLNDAYGLQIDKGGRIIHR